MSVRLKVIMQLTCVCRVCHLHMCVRILLLSWYSSGAKEGICSGMSVRVMVPADQLGRNLYPLGRCKGLGRCRVSKKKDALMRTTVPLT